MSGIGSFIIGLIVVAVVVALLIWLLSWLYRRSSKEISFVRTGLGGQKVVMNGGAFVLPIVHEIIPVNMNTLRLEVKRGRESALITRDRMRVDVVAEFYVRVQPSAEAIAIAAQTLGQRTMQPEALRELIEGKFVDALRSVAAEMTMEEMHEQRGEYARRVAEAVGRGPLQERPGARDGVADRARPDQHGVLQPVERVRCRGPDAPDRADRAAQEAPQRHRAGHDDPDPQQEPGGRAARPRRSTARASMRASQQEREIEGRRAAQRAELVARARPARAGDRSRRRSRRAAPSRRRASPSSGRSTRSASAARSETAARWRSSGARRWSWPSRTARLPSPSNPAPNQRRRRRPMRPAPAPSPPRRRCSPRARWRSPSGARASS